MRGYKVVSYWSKTTLRMNADGLCNGRMASKPRNYRLSIQKHTITSPTTQHAKGNINMNEDIDMHVGLLLTLKYRTRKNRVKAIVDYFCTWFDEILLLSFIT